MQIRLAYTSTFLGPGKTFAVPTAAGARVRVVDGLVWATTSSNSEDVWLGAGEEHTIRRPGLTVIESLGQSTVELIPAAATGIRSRVMNRYEMALPKTARNIAAIAMTAITFGLLVVLPAKLESDSQGHAPAASSVLIATPNPMVVSQARGASPAPGPKIAQASSGATSPTRVE